MSSDTLTRTYKLDDCRVLKIIVPDIHHHQYLGTYKYLSMQHKKNNWHSVSLSIFRCSVVITCDNVRAIPKSKTHMNITLCVCIVRVKKPSIVNIKATTTDQKSIILSDRVILINVIVYMWMRELPLRLCESNEDKWRVNDKPISLSADLNLVLEPNRSVRNINTCSSTRYSLFP